MSCNRKLSRSSEGSSSTRSVDSRGEYLHTIASKFEAGDTWHHAILKNNYGWTPFGNYVDHSAQVQQQQQMRPAEGSHAKVNQVSSAPMQKNMRVKHMMPASYQPHQPPVMRQNIPSNYMMNVMYGASNVNFCVDYMDNNAQGPGLPRPAASNVMCTTPANVDAPVPRRTNYNVQWWTSQCENIHWVDSPNISDSDDDEDEDEEDESKGHDTTKQDTAQTSARQTSKNALESPTEGDKQVHTETASVVSNTTTEQTKKAPDISDEGAKHGASTAVKTESNENDEVEHALSAKFSDMFSDLLNESNGNKDRHKNGPANVHDNAKDNSNNDNADANSGSYTSSDSSGSDSTYSSADKSSQFNSDDETGNNNENDNDDGVGTTIIFDKSMAKDVCATSFAGAVYRMLNDKSTTKPVSPPPPPPPREVADKQATHSHSNSHAEPAKTVATKVEGEDTADEHPCRPADASAVKSYSTSATREGNSGDANGPGSTHKTADHELSHPTARAYKGSNTAKHNGDDVKTDGVRHNNARTNGDANAETKKNLSNARALDAPSDPIPNTVLKADVPKLNNWRAPQKDVSEYPVSTYDFAQLLRQQRAESASGATPTATATPASTPSAVKSNCSPDRGTVDSIASSPHAHTTSYHNEYLLRRDSGIDVNALKPNGAESAEKDCSTDRSSNHSLPYKDSKSHRAIQSSLSPADTTSTGDNVLIHSKDYSWPPAFFLSSPFPVKLKHGDMDAVLFDTARSSQPGGIYTKESHTIETHASPLTHEVVKNKNSNNLNSNAHTNGTGKDMHNNHTLKSVSKDDTIHTKHDEHANNDDSKDGSDASRLSRTDDGVSHQVRTDAVNDANRQPALVVGSTTTIISSKPSDALLNANPFSPPRNGSAVIEINAQSKSESKVQSKLPMSAPPSPQEKQDSPNWGKLATIGKTPECISLLHNGDIHNKVSTKKASNDVNMKLTLPMIVPKSRVVPLRAEEMSPAKKGKK